MPSSLVMPVQFHNNGSVEMHEGIVDKGLLKRRNKDQLAEIVKETGITGLFGTSFEKFKKGEIVKALAKHFKAIFENDLPNEDEKAIKDWLPAVFAFPAINPDAKENP